MDSVETRVYLRAVRPTAFTSTEPEDVTPPGDQVRQFRWRLMTAAGAEVCAAIQISFWTTFYRVTNPGHLDESVFAAALTNGRTLLEQHVIGRDDPPLTWYVDAEHVWFDAA